MRLLIVSLCFLMFTACSGNSDVDENCNFLLDLNVNVSLNLNLPQFSQLQFVSNPVYVPNYGNGGIIVTNIGSGFVAFDASDPNRSPTSCSILIIEGIHGKSGCADENEYNLFNGLPVDNANLRCPLKAYRVEANGNTLLVFN